MTGRNRQRTKILRKSIWERNNISFRIEHAYYEAQNYQTAVLLFRFFSFQPSSTLRKFNIRAIFSSTSVRLKLMLESEVTRSDNVFSASHELLKKPPVLLLFWEKKERGL